MRGKVTSTVGNVAGNRITPAYAGKSQQIARYKYSQWDHPRLCGEKLSVKDSTVPLLGSPPPMRGKDSQTSTALLLIGITPAYAGKSSRYRLISISSRDHPRLCGEKFPCPSASGFRFGSPPPMRGKVSSTTPKEKSIGITPAYAGKSERKMKNESYTEDHPRLCGEKKIK